MNKFSEIKEAQLLTLFMQDKVKQYTKLAQLALEDEKCSNYFKTKEEAELYAEKIRELFKERREK